MVRKTIEQIRAEYPNPRSALTAGVLCDYCVGGAIILACQLGSDRFPVKRVLAKRLQMLNPQLSDNGAMAYAYAITIANDANDFDKAWTLANNALTHREGAQE